MSKTKHTEGPWHWIEARTQMHLNNRENSCFAQISMPIPKGKETEWTKRMRADANLIAQAPRLLAALKTLVDQAQEKYPHFESERGQKNIALALLAIQAAEGEE